ncbi:unnamed protein product, partial [Prunus brigantina]
SSSVSRPLPISEPKPSLAPSHLESLFLFVLRLHACTILSLSLFLSQSLLYSQDFRLKFIQLECGTFFLFKLMVLKTDREESEPSISSFSTSNSLHVRSISFLPPQFLSVILRNPKTPKSQNPNRCLLIS